MSDRVVPVLGVGEVLPAVIAHARAVFTERRTLADVLKWARAQSPPRTVAEIVTQDEYTHDVVLPFDGAHFLVFDAT